MSERRAVWPRRAVLRLAGGLGLAVPLTAGCGGSERGSGLTATWWGDPGINDALTRAVRAFRASGRGGTPIRSEFLAWDGYWDKLATRSGGGDTPDLVMQAATYLPEYVGRRALLPLDRYLGRGLDLDRLDPNARGIGRYQGRTYAVVAATNALTVIVNRTLLGELEVAEPADDTRWSWEDLERIAVRVHRRSGGEVYGVQDAGGDLMSFQVFVRQRGLELFDAHDRVSFPRALLGEWFALWHRWRERGAAPPPDMSAESVNMLPQYPLTRRRAAMTLGWTQDIGSYAALLADSYAALLPPGPPPAARDARTRPGLWINAASLWSVAADTRRPKEVIALVDFLLNDPRAARELGTKLGTPPRADLRGAAREDADPVTRTGLDHMDRVARHSTPLPRVWPAGFTELRDEFSRYNQDVSFGLRSPDEAASDFLELAEEVVGR